MFCNIKKKRTMVENYIRQHPNSTWAEIQKQTRIKLERVYTSLREAYIRAGVPLSPSLSKRSKQEQVRDVLQFIREHPGCTVTDIQQSKRVCLFRLFGSITKAYEAAGVHYNAKQVTFGIQNPAIAKRSKKYEKKIISLLREIGTVQHHVRTKRGIADCLFTYFGQKFVVEVKDFRARNNITMSQIKQLLRYMDELQCQHGLLICPKSSFPRRKNGRNVYKGAKAITILSVEDLRGRGIKDNSPYSLASIAASRAVDGGSNPSVPIVSAS